MAVAVDREEIIDAVARERRWRTPPYLVLYFLRRWAVLLFTLSFMLASGQHWAVAAIAIAGALWFDLKITRNALDLRLGDREFVRKIYDLEVFETDLREKHGKRIKRVIISILCFLFVSIFAKILFDYNTVVNVNRYLLGIILWAVFLYCVAFLARMNPIHKTGCPLHSRSP